MSNYPENDYRGYLIHWSKGGESKNHKYLSRKMGSNGKWIYTYAKGAANKVRAVANEARTFKEDADVMGVGSAVGNAMVREADRGNGLIKYHSQVERERQERARKKAEKKKKKTQKAYNNIALRKLSSFGSSVKKKTSSAVKSGAKKAGKKLIDKHFTSETNGKTTNYYSKKTGRRVAQVTRK